MSWPSQVDAYIYKLNLNCGTELRRIDSYENPKQRWNRTASSSSFKFKPSLQNYGLYYIYVLVPNNQEMVYPITRNKAVIYSFLVKKLSKDLVGKYTYSHSPHLFLNVKYFAIPFLTLLSAVSWKRQTLTL